MNKIIIVALALLCITTLASAQCEAADSKQCEDLYGLCIYNNLISNYCVSCIPDYSACLYRAGCKSYDPFSKTCNTDLKCQDCKIAAGFSLSPLSFVGMIAFAVIAMLF